MSNSTKTKFSVRIDSKLVSQMDECMEVANARSRTELMENAIEFYMGYLTAGRIENYLLQSLSSVISSTVKDSENCMARMDFKLAEITPEHANQIAYELAMRFTKGNNAFIVATHVDKAHIHSHIIFNSTTLDCQRKFRDFLGSGKALRRINDRLCLEHGLSIIESPKLGNTHYGKWLGDDKKPSFREQLRTAIDAMLLKKPESYDVFVALMQEAGYEYKDGKFPSFRSSGQERFTRLRTLKDGYSGEEIRAVIEGEKQHVPQKRFPPKNEPPRVNLLIDIQEKLQSGKGAGYEHWAKVFNLKQMAQTLNFLTENKLLEYDALEKAASELAGRYGALSAEIKDAERRMAELSSLQIHIVNYSKTRDTYVAYRKAGYSKKFLAENEGDILIHKTAKKAFDDLGIKKLPTVKGLREEYAELLAEKKKAYGEFVKVRSDMRSAQTAKANVDRLLGKGAPSPKREQGHEQR